MKVSFNAKLQFQNGILMACWNVIDRVDASLA